MPILSYSSSSEGSFRRALKKDINGCHFETHFSLEPLREYLIFSSLRKNITSVSQAEIEGGCLDFQLRRILRRAKRVVKETISASLEVNEDKSEGTPKMAIKGHGFRVVLRTSERVLQIDCQ